MEEEPGVSRASYPEGQGGSGGTKGETRPVRRSRSRTPERADQLVTEVGGGERILGLTRCQRPLRGMLDPPEPAPRRVQSRPVDEPFDAGPRRGPRRSAVQRPPSHLSRQGSMVVPRGPSTLEAPLSWRVLRKSCASAASDASQLSDGGGRRFSPSPATNEAPREARRLLRSQPCYATFRSKGRGSCSSWISPASSVS
jgi:hypothetical protein